VWGLRCWVWGLGFRVYGYGCRVQEVGFKVKRPGFRVHGIHLLIPSRGFQDVLKMVLIRFKLESVGLVCKVSYSILQDQGIHTLKPSREVPGSSANTACGACPAARRTRRARSSTPSEGTRVAMRGASELMRPPLNAYDGRRPNV